MNIDQKTAKINMFFGHRFGVALGWVFEEVWEAKNLNFGSFFEQKSKAKKHDVLEGPKKPSRRGKKQSLEVLSSSEHDQGRHFGAQIPSWGGEGGGYYQKKHVRYLTRPGAQGPQGGFVDVTKATCWLSNAPWG